MADSYKLTDGTTEIELQYDSVSQTNYTLQYGSQVQIDAPDVLMHVPDDGEELPVRTVYRNRRMFFTLNANGADWDTVLNNVAAVRRLIRQANRYWVTGDVNRVSMRIQKDGATNYTDHPIKYGYIRDDDAYYTEAQNILGWKPVIVLEVGPYGEGASFTLRNDLPSSPHCIEDSNSDGRPDGWTIVNFPTVSINTHNYLIGGKSLAMSGSNLDGVNTPTATATAPDIAAYVWVHVASGAATIDFRDSTGSVQQYTLTSTDSNEVSDKTITSSSGDTWYRVSYSASLSGNNPFIRILCSGTSQLRIDGAYLQTGTTTVPDAWCSTSAIENRYDPTSSDEARINYVDVWGIPGDAPAIVDQQLTFGASVNEAMIIGKGASGNYDAATRLHWFDGADLRVAYTAGSDSSPSDAARSGGTYIRYTGGLTSTLIQFDFTIATADAAKFNNSWLRVFLVARSSSSDTAFYLDDVTANNKTVITESQGITTANTWELIDVGAIQFSNSNLYSTYNPSVADTTVIIRAVLGADAGTIDLDAVLMVPTDEYFIAKNFSISNSDSFILGNERLAINDFTTSQTSALGTMYEIDNEVSTRFIYAMYSSNTNAHDLDDTATVAFTIYPRTRHLLGTS